MIINHQWIPPCVHFFFFNKLVVCMSPLRLQEKFHTVLLCSELCRTEPELLERLWTACADAIFSLTQRETQLGFKEEVCLGEVGAMI